MNKNKTFNVTLLDNRYGDNTRSATITWQELMKRVADPPVYKVKGKDGIIAGECEWEDGVATKTIEINEPLFDGAGAPVLNEYGNQKTTKTTKKIQMFKRNGEPIKRPVNGTRHVINRSILFLDCDSIDDFNKWLDSIFELCNWWGWAFALYSSFSATEKKPRYRVIIPLSKPVDPEEYKKIARAVMYNLDEENFDPVSDRANQIMFLPVWPKLYNPETKENENGFYEFFIEDDGDPLDVDSFLSYLDAFKDDEEYKKPIRSAAGEPVERMMRKIHEAKNKKEDFDTYSEGDPRNKNNIVGDFCRAYSISEAIEEFDLPYDYISENTYKLRGSKSPPGVFIKNDDTYLYSYHTTDPAYGIDKNAFDLVKVHKFDGDYIKMCAFARQILNKPHD